MIARAALVLGFAATTAAAGAPPAKLAAVAPDPTGASVSHATLVGPAGQLYAPSAADPARWSRTSAAGIATTITAIAVAGAELLAGGASSPAFRWHAGTWTADPLPAHGALVLGAGPALAAAVGTAVFVRTAGTWTRLPTAAPAAPTALWAASPTDVWLIAGGAAWHLRGKAFTRGPAALGLAPGPRPLAIAADAAIDLSANRTVHAATAGATIVAAAAAGPDVALLVRDPHGALTVERHPPRGAATTRPAPAAPAWTWIWADAHAIALAAPTGQVALLATGAWHDGRVDDLAPAAAHAGPGPAASR